jgi:hypothetical protein
MSCQARVKGGISYEFSGKEFFQGKECCQPSYRKICVDGGDSYFYACKECFNNFTKQREKWYGWFDCDIPMDAPIIESFTYWNSLSKIYMEDNPGAKWEYLTYKILREWLEKQSEDEDVEEITDKLKENTI